MTVPNGSLHLAGTRLPPEEEHLLTQRVTDALWQAQVQQMRSQDWFNFAADGYVLTDLQGVIYEANYAAAVLLDVRKEFLLGKPLGLFMKDRSRWVFYQRLSRLIEGGTERWEARLSRANGQSCDVGLTVAAVPGAEGQAVKLRWMLHDLTSARRAERAWLAEKGLADCLLEMTEVLILLVDEHGSILRCNPYVRMVSGYASEELQGQSWGERLLPETEQEAGRRLLAEARVNSASRSGVVDLLTRNQEKRRVLWSARKLGLTLLLIGHDVTELEEAQQQALRVERLAAIGQLSAGLAHESRNALQRSQACVALLGLRLQGQPECLELLKRIEKAQDDLQHLFDDVRTYATPRLEPRWCNLAETWREAWNDLAALPEWASAQLYEDLDDTGLFCEVDPFYLKQVFRNLLENALAAGASPVRIVLRCRLLSRDGNEALCIRLRDNGPGIPAAVRPHLFEPFFTTKVRGTGLGLAICRRVVEAHGGEISIEENSAPGAEIVIILPRRGT